MTRLAALRRYALAHPTTCKRLDRLYPNDEALRAVLNDASALASHLIAAGRLDRDALDRLIAPLVSGEGDAPPSSQSQLMDVRTVAKYA